MDEPPLEVVTAAAGKTYEAVQPLIVDARFFARPDAEGLLRRAHLDRAVEHEHAVLAAAVGLDGVDSLIVGHVAGAGGIEADEVLTGVGALDGYMAVAQLDDGLGIVAVVGIENGFDVDGGVVVERQDVPVGKTDLRAAAAGGGDVVAGIDRQVHPNVDLAAVVALLEDRAAVVVREVGLVAALLGEGRKRQHEGEKEEN